MNNYEKHVELQKKYKELVDEREEEKKKLIKANSKNILYDPFFVVVCILTPVLGVFAITNGPRFFIVLFSKLISGKEELESFDYITLIISVASVILFVVFLIIFIVKCIRRKNKRNKIHEEDKKLDKNIKDLEEDIQERMKRIVDEARELSK